MSKKQVQKELKVIANQIKVYLQEQRYLDPDEIMPVSNEMAVSNITRLDKLRNKVEKCRNCKLGSIRIKSVFGEGAPNARIMFVGEGPGYDEDRQGKPFVGKSGQLLTRIIQAIKFSREEVYIANIVKCHPMLNPEKVEMRGNDRPPTKEETKTCLSYLLEQIEIINPEIICTLGNPAVQILLGTTETISKLRGKTYTFKGRKLIPTYHPAALLRNPNLKSYTWNDMKLLMSNLKK
jgi:DNA polymerase